jgi:dolichol-phosphate mannosyltransferase
VAGVRAAHVCRVATPMATAERSGDTPSALTAPLGSSSPKPQARWAIARRDTWLRRLSSRIANGVRGAILKDGTPDTGCGIKVFDRAVFVDMPRFKNMHRFMPALYQREGYEVVSVPVNHRSRTRGTSKYGLHNRLWVGIVDLFGMMWLIRRASPRVRTTEES